MGRINKGLRLRQDVLDRAAHLRTYHPEYETEAAMLNAILYCGLLLMEAEVLSGGGAPPPGYTGRQIITMVVPKLLPALQLLRKSGVLAPVTIPRSLTNAEHAMAARGLEEEIDVQAGEALERLGSTFL